MLLNNWIHSQFLSFSILSIYLIIFKYFIKYQILFHNLLFFQTFSFFIEKINSEPIQKNWILLLFFTYFVLILLYMIIEYNIHIESTRISWIKNLKNGWGVTRAELHIQQYKVYFMSKFILPFLIFIRIIMSIMFLLLNINDIKDFKILIETSLIETLIYNQKLLYIRI